MSILDFGKNSPLFLLAKKELSVFKGNAIVKSQLCWVHMDVGSIEYHHIVPQTYGGENGPQVAICGNCHTGIHNLSFKSLIFDGTIDDIETQINLTEKFASEWISRTTLSGPNKRRILVRAWALGEVIFRSRKLATSEQNLSNKRIKYATEFSGKEASMLRALSKSFGVTQDILVHIALEEMYHKYIGEK